ncbi:MAG: DUF1624 domain-containing protein [Candidatus Lokiarchaeota archaeon]|nr:DUF1624 domain-containing protein [Candidatus Lokiarchaeota archaeon]
MAEKQRLHFLDLGRFVAIFFMVLSHIKIEYGSDKLAESYAGYFIEAMSGPPAAPVFMFSMGFLIVFTKKTDIKSGLSRGLKIFLIGLILNIVRYVIPRALNSWINNIQYIIYGENFSENLFFLTFEVDILFFAGLAYCLVIIAVNYTSKRTILVLYLLIAFSSPYLWGLYTNHTAVNLFLDLIWGNRAHVYFPQFSWLCYPLLGAYVGYLFMENKEIPKKRFHIFYIGLVLLIFGGILTALDVENQIGDYYHSGAGAVLLYSGFTILWLLVCKRLISWVGKRVTKHIEYVSTNLLSIYCIHWTILGWFILLISRYSYDLGGVLLIFIIVYPLSLILTKYIKIRV